MPEPCDDDAGEFRNYEVLDQPPVLTSVAILESEMNLMHNSGMDFVGCVGFNRVYRKQSPARAEMVRVMLEVAEELRCLESESYGAEAMERLEELGDKLREAVG